MIVLLTGASGAIGSAILHHSLQHPSITSIITLTRRPLPSSLTSSLPNPQKLQSIIIPDFGDLSSIPEESWTKMMEADALVWAIGTYTVDEDVNCKDPMMWQKELSKRRSAHLQKTTMEHAKAFTFLLLGGAFVEPNQSATLFFLSTQRKQKGVLQKFTIDFAAMPAQKEAGWRGTVIRPGGVLFGGATVTNRVVEGVFGRGLAIRGEELGAAVAGLVVEGKEGVVANAELVERGREALRREGVEGRE